MGVLDMKLSTLLQGICYETTLPDLEIEVTGLTGDSRQLEAGHLFVCMRGLRFDGHSYAQTALEQGAAAVVTERDLGLPRQIVVQDSFRAYAVLCANFFGRPADRMKLIGITGTNGKTTSAFLIKQILSAAGYHVGLMGTIQNEIGDLILPAKYTTPDPYQLHSMLARMEQAGCAYVVMEVSSHALAQDRVYGLHFAAAVFTNLTQDHLDYHGTMENYFAAKQKLFSMCDLAVVNVDDAHGARIAKEAACPVVTCSAQRGDADCTVQEIRHKLDGSTFALKQGEVFTQVRIPMPGQFSVYNAMGAAACCIALGVPDERVVEALAHCGGVTGRFEVIPTALPFTVVRDYAHTTDGLEKILTAVQELGPKRIVTLFGCAGCRDDSKRAAMGEAVSRLSDFVIITSDNPREEDPQKIIDDAMPGILEHEKPFRAFLDRYEAIEWALHNGEEGDILLLLGKGHEDYQVLDFGSVYFNEREIVQKLAAEMLQTEEA